MTEHTLKTHVAPPEGWEYDELRAVKKGEYFLSNLGEALLWDNDEPSAGIYIILRRARWVPKPGEAYYSADQLGFIVPQNAPCSAVRIQSGNYWRTREQAEAYAAACRALAERMRDD
jgi:hypothetical protein